MPSPRMRALAGLLALVGTLLATSPILLALGWLAGIVPVAWISRILKTHLRFVLVVILPLGLALCVVWGLIVAAPPGQPLGAAPAAGLRFAVATALRLLVLGGIVQLSLLTIPRDALPYTLRCWGMKGDGLIIGLGAMALMPELALRVDQVLTARLARGLITDRSMLTTIRQFPYLLRPLLTWALRSAIQRSEMWHQRQLLGRLNRLSEVERESSTLAGTALVLLGTGWLIVNAWARFHGHR